MLGALTSNRDCEIVSDALVGDALLRGLSVVRIDAGAGRVSPEHGLTDLAADRASFGPDARLALAYYYYPVSGCTSNTCQLTAGFVSSLDGGATWTPPKQMSGPMNLSWIANTSQGRMVGDYISTSFAGGYAFPLFAIAKPPTGGVFFVR